MPYGRFLVTGLFAMAVRAAIGPETQPSAIAMAPALVDGSDQPPSDTGFVTPWKDFDDASQNDLIQRGLARKIDFPSAERDFAAAVANVVVIEPEQCPAIALNGSVSPRDACTGTRVVSLSRLALAQARLLITSVRLHMQAASGRGWAAT